MLNKSVIGIFSCFSNIFNPLSTAHNVPQIWHVAVHLQKVY